MESILDIWEIEGKSLKELGSILCRINVRDHFRGQKKIKEKNLIMFGSVPFSPFHWKQFSESHHTHWIGLLY